MFAFFTLRFFLNVLGANQLEQNQFAVIPKPPFCQVNNSRISAFSIQIPRAKLAEQFADYRALANLLTLLILDYVTVAQYRDCPPSGRQCSLPGKRNQLLGETLDFLCLSDSRRNRLMLKKSYRQIATQRYAMLACST
jgi:hypothetical protein